jgi:uncharacterized DUF497 family protein
MYNRTYTVDVEVEWDEGKARSNLRKHGVGFAEAEGVFRDELAIAKPDERAGEQRWVALGADVNGNLLVIVYTWRGKRVRLISARRATGLEVRKYREGP